MRLKEWMRNFLKGEQVRDDLLPATPPDVETVEKLINRTISKTKRDESKNFEGSQNSDESVRSSEVHSESEEGQSSHTDRGNEEVGDPVEVSGKGGCCSYGVKRNIVSSMKEVRKFAEEHGLTESVMQALLRIIAEIALNALKGKVSAGALLMLLNAMNFDKVRQEAYKEGEQAGRNARIEEEYFPTVDDGLPKLNGTHPRRVARNDFFDIARKA